MIKMPLDSDGEFFLLQPRWAEYGLTLQIALLALLLVGPLLLVLWLYRYELCLVSRWQAGGLLALRVGLILLLWVTVGFQPHFAEIHVTETPGRIRVAVDLSSSMEVS